MTTVSPLGAAVEDGPGDQVHAVGDQVSRLVRVAKTWRSRVVDPRRHPQVAAHLLLLQLDRLGSMRPGALADATHTDASTISRHVALLLTERLVERQADASDGRATLLGLTDLGRERVRDMRRRRDDMVRRVLADWPAEDVSGLAHLLSRFNDGFENSLPAQYEDQEMS